MATTFLHTADWQLGKPFARIEDPANREAVIRERVEAVRRLGKLAREREVDFVVVAGDLFDSFQPEKRVVSAACGAIGEMGAPVIVIPGNHDHGGPGCVWTQDFFLRERETRAPNLRVALAAEPLELDEATIFPCPLLRRHEAGDPTAWLRGEGGEGGREGGGESGGEADDPAEGASDDKPRIVLAHGGVHGFDSAGTDDEEAAVSPNRIDLERLPRDRFDYIALGDWHGTMCVDEGAWYAGTPEADRFAKGENNRPGHALVVTAERGGRPVVEQVATGRLGWHRLSFTFAADGDVERLGEELDRLLGPRTHSDLLELRLGGALGIGAAAHLEKLVETWEARLLRVKRKEEVAVVPGDEELSRLTENASDPLIARVASGLAEEAGGTGEGAEVARIALRELFVLARED